MDAEHPRGVSGVDGCRHKRSITHISGKSKCGTCPPYSLSAVVLEEDGGKDFITIR